MSSRTSPPIPTPLWQDPRLGQPGGPSFGIAEAARQARTWTGRAKIVQQAHQRTQELYTVWRDRREWEPLRSPARQEAESAYDGAMADLAAALANVYPLAFQSAFDALREGRPADPTPLIEFLEADPYFYGSGYMKETVIRLVKRCDLTPTEAERLRGVVLHIVERPEWRREFRHYTRLARKVDSPEFRAALQDFAKNGFLREQVRANWILASLNP